jgi:5-methylcytosine-specific restriction endonuclease McrA
MTKEEKSAYNKAYNLANKEKRVAQNKAYHLVNKEKKAAHTKAWRLANPEKKAAHTKAWDKANREKIAAYRKVYFLKLNLMNKNISKRTLSAWAAQVRARDTACLYCGSTSNLHAHHILSKVKHPDWALFLNNGITLCEPCHIQEHTINGDL